MEAVCDPVLHDPEPQQPVRNDEVVQIECNQHWGVLLLPALSLLVWLSIGVFFAASLARMVDEFSLARNFAAPLLILCTFLGSTSIMFLLRWSAYRRSKLRLTSKTASLKDGTLLNVSREIDLGQAESVTMVEPALGRLFNYGTVCIAGAGGANFRIRFVPNPHQFHRALLKAIENRWSKVDWRHAHQHADGK